MSFIIFIIIIISNSNKINPLYKKSKVSNDWSYHVVFYATFEFLPYKDYIDYVFIYRLLNPIIQFSEA